MNSSIPSGLPSEIFDNIIGRVEGRNNLKSLRLTCRALNSFATRWLFRDIYISICSLRADDRFQKLIEKYGHLVRELDVDGIYGPRSDCLCPFEVTPFLERMPFLQEIRMRGTYHSWFHDEIQSEGFLELLRRASLQTSPQDRVLQNLRCLNLDLWMETDEDWFLDDFGVVFIIQSLQELALNGLTLASKDPEVPPGFEGQTDLKMLCIKESYIDIGALDNMLSFPRALTCLRLQNRPPRAEDRPDGWHEENRTPADLHQAIAKQRLSLELLEIQGWLPACSTSIDFNLSQFPQLREYDGCYEDSSGKFTRGGIDSSVSL